MKHIGKNLHLGILYVFVFSLLFIMQKYTLGYIPGFKSIVIFNKFYFYELLFAINAILIIKFFIKIDLPSKPRHFLREQ